MDNTIITTGYRSFTHLFIEKENIILDLNKKILKRLILNIGNIYIYANSLMSNNVTPEGYSPANGSDIHKKMVIKKTN